jgi:carbamate kinase
MMNGLVGTAVVALGGNAITAEGESGTYAEQRMHAEAMARCLCEMLDVGWRVVVVHGNGPQVGNLAIQQEAGQGDVPPMPLFALGAMTQGHIGSLVALALRRVSAGRHHAVAMVSHVAVDLEDPAFDSPTKPIGPFYPQAAAFRLAAERGWTMLEDGRRGYRRVVPSPRPLGLLEIEAVRSLLEAGHVVVADGGGGVPVTHGVSGPVGVDAVIDKDHAAAELALQVGAEALVLVTAVDAVMLDFGTDAQRRLGCIDVAEAERHLTAGQFPAGSMQPKMAAAVRFVRGGGRVAVVTTAELASATLLSAGDTTSGLGTTIVATRRREGARHEGARHEGPRREGAL